MQTQPRTSWIPAIAKKFIDQQPAAIQTPVVDWERQAAIRRKQETVRQKQSSFSVFKEHGILQGGEGDNMKTDEDSQVYVADAMPPGAHVRPAMCPGKVLNILDTG